MSGRASPAKPSWCARQPPNTCATHPHTTKHLHRAGVAERCRRLVIAPRVDDLGPRKRPLHDPARIGLRVQNHGQPHALAANSLLHVVHHTEVEGARARLLIEPVRQAAADARRQAASTASTGAANMQPAHHLTEINSRPTPWLCEHATGPQARQLGTPPGDAKGAAERWACTPGNARAGRLLLTRSMCTSCPRLCLASGAGSWPSFRKPSCVCISSANNVAKDSRTVGARVRSGCVPLGPAARLAVVRRGTAHAARHAAAAEQLVRRGQQHRKRDSRR